MLAQSALLLRLQTDVLEAVARGNDLAAVATLLCKNVETLLPHLTCSVLSVNDAGQLRSLAAPSMSSRFTAAIDGLQMGPKAGSCGTAAFRNAEVIVTNVGTDPLWEDYRALAEPLGIKACWSSPIQDQQGKVIGTFAFYYAEHRGPDALERAVVQTCVHLCAIAMEHHRARARSEQLAYYDELTGLPNRGQFLNLLAKAIAQRRPFGLLLADLDHLKLHNDTAGHDVGDILIRTVAERISGASPDLVACRVGGDEFAILVSDCATDEDLARAARLVLEAVAGLVDAKGQAVDPHITMGGALYGPDGLDPATLSQNADVALYQAKETRRGGFLPFVAPMRIAISQRVAMVRSVDQALAEGRMIAHYQPIVKLETGEIVGLEALARMRMDDGRIATAGEFHAALADPRIAWQVTGQILRQVAADIRGWLDRGIDFQHVGINVTTGDFVRGDLEQRLVAAFEQEEVPLRHLVLEVNEAVFMGGNDQRVPKAVSALRQRGLLVALDDFGTGFASLTHLLSFPVDIIKIDKSFVDRLGTDHRSEVLVGAIIDIARRLDMRLVAEGIETKSQADMLGALGCTMGQGFLFSRAVAPEDATRLLELYAQ
jgi:diguanylate cyclase (GGDEF)-like protein